MAFTSVTDQLHKATFRGIDFLFSSSSRTGGRKHVLHEYPNKDVRFVEDLGKTVPTFSINIVINGKEDYVNKRNKFLQALEQKGFGILSHPFYGNLNVIVCEYTLEESITTLGVATFSVTFAISEDTSQPQANITNGSAVATKYTSIQLKNTNNFKSNYIQANNNKYLQAFNTLMVNRQSLSLAGIMSHLTANSGIGVAGFYAANTFINYIKQAASLISNNSDLINTRVYGSVDYINNIDVDSALLYAAYSRQFGFNSDYTPPTGNTKTESNITANFYLFTSTYNITILLNAYQYALDVEYHTTQDVSIVKSALESQYQYLLSMKNLNYDLLNDIKDIRNDMRLFFDEVNRNVYRATTITTAEMPLTVLTYSYYGNLDLESDILKLNEIKEPSFVSGNVRILIN